jgi:DNA-binding NtrC family response regulator
MRRLPVATRWRVMPRSACTTDKQAVADALGITTKTLRAKIQKWELE